MQAPWNISSADINAEFDTVNSRYDARRGIRFESPRNLIDNTRDQHNEIVTEKLLYDSENDKITRRKPSFIIHFKENNDEMSEDSTKYQQALKAASQLKIPIVFIDRNAFAIQEEQKIDDYLAIFEGKKENTLNLTQQELLSKIIVGFENNKNGLQFSNLSRKYFTNEKRKQILGRLMSFISNQKPKEQLDNLRVLQDIINQEESKTLTGTKEEARYDFSEDYVRLSENISNILSNFEERTFNNKGLDKHEFITSSIANVKTSDINKAVDIIKSSVMEKEQSHDLEENKYNGRE